MAVNLDAFFKAIQAAKGNGVAASAQTTAQKPAYGQEVARPTGEQALAGLINAIQSYRKDNPISLPFPAGTPTLAARQFAEEQKQNQFARSRTGSGVGSGSAGTQTERRNQVLNQLVPGVLRAKQNNVSKEDVVSELMNNIGEFGYSVMPEDINKLVNSIYGEDTGTETISGLDFNNEPQMTAEEIQRQALKQRPWWQKLIDILPGPQFR